MVWYFEVAVPMFNFEIFPWVHLQYVRYTPYTVQIN